MPSPIILLANYAEIITGHPRGAWEVHSRMLLWSLGGSGYANINDTHCPLHPNRFLFIPWKHRITYYSTASGPLQLAGIHLIPDMPIGEPVEYLVQHDPGSRPNIAGIRNDCPMNGLVGLIQGYWQPDTPLYALADYIVRWFLSGKQTEQAARRLAEQLIEELTIMVRDKSLGATRIPGRLRQIIGHINNNLHRPVKAEELARTGNCTTSTVQRLFQRYLSDTPSCWIQKRRMEKAAKLLTTTLLPVCEVGQAVGIDDPYYFSRLFRKIHRITPTEHRRRTAIAALL